MRFSPETNKQTKKHSEFQICSVSLLHLWECEGNAKNGQSGTLTSAHPVFGPADRSRRERGWGPA